MIALTICQPYAQLIAVGEKRVENRDWFTWYRGPLAIHAGKSRDWLRPHDNPDAGGPYCLMLRSARPLPEPIPARGRQGLLWEWSPPQ